MKIFIACILATLLSGCTAAISQQDLAGAEAFCDSREGIYKITKHVNSNFASYYCKNGEVLYP